jgi:hypothetical protein
MPDGGFAAGLIAGEGSFGIRPNNGASSWTCQLQLRLRADDTPLLAAMCRWSGVGRLSPFPAQARSHPQTVWMIQRQADCLRVVSLLERYALLGKKSGEFAIWRRAVLALTSKRSDRNSLVAGCANELTAHRRPDHSFPFPEVHISDEYLLAFLAGFLTAEAHFGATAEGHPSLIVNLRRDDGALLHVFRDRLGIGRLAEVPPRGRSRAALSWRVGTLVETRALVALLDRNPPRGRVLRVYEAWRRLVLLEVRRRPSRRQLAIEVRRRREFKPGLGTIVRTDPLEARRQRHLRWLRDWSAVSEGPRTGTAYEAWRRRSAREAPTRNTVAASFGSWRRAILAAGLRADGCFSEAAIERVRRTTALALAERKAEQRAAVVEAVSLCARALGRVPRATEFFTWRHRYAPGAPCQMTVYRLFPGGWQAVLAAIDEPRDDRSKQVA